MLDTPVGEMFYKRTLSCYNFVANDDRNVNFYIWPETERKRAANEVETSFTDFVMQEAKPNVKNRVYPVMNTQTELFFMCFLERHTENIADKIHCLIERENNISVYSPTN